MWRRVLLGVALLVALVVGTAFLVDWDGLARDWVERALAAKTGREVHLEHVRFHAQLPLRIELVGLTIANPQWARQQPLLALERADFTLRLLPLLKREVVLPQVTLVKPVANLEQHDGKRSWVFDEEQRREQGAGGDLPHIGVLAVDSATVRYLDPASGTALTVLASQRGQPGGKGGLTFDASGRYRDEQVKVRGEGASLLTLMDQADPYLLKLDASVGKTTASFDGEVINVAKLERVSGDFAIQGDNLEHLYRILGVTVPATPPYRLQGRLSREGALWRLQRFAGGVGDSDVSGDLSYDGGQKPPLLQAQLHSKLLDFDDLGPLVGAPPKTGPGETASAEQKKQSDRQDRKGEAVPDASFNTQRWGRLNAEVSVQAAKIRRKNSLPIDDLSARMTLRDKVIELHPLRFGVASGNVDSTIRLDGRREPLAVQVATAFRNLQVNRLMPNTKGGRNSVGSLFGEAKLAARGDSMKAMTQTLDGQVRLTMGQGRLSELVFEALGLDAAEVVRIFATGDDTVRLRCMIANLGIWQGILKPDALVVATEDANVMGTGTVDLGREQLDLTLYTAPKDPSPISFRAPLHVRGSFKDPKVRPDAGVLAAKAGAAVLLGLVNPVLAVVPLIETGPGTQSSCGELIRQAKGWQESKDPAAKAVKRDEEKHGAQAGAAAAAGRAQERVPDMPRADDVLRAERRAHEASPARASNGKTSAGRATKADEGEAKGGAEDAPRAEDVLRKDREGG
jgi:AsmA protein